MRYFLTDLRGNPIYSFAHARRLRRSHSGSNSNNNNNNSSNSSNNSANGNNNFVGFTGFGFDNSNNTTTNYAVTNDNNNHNNGVIIENDRYNTSRDNATSSADQNSNNNNNHTSQHHYQSNSNYIRRGSYSQHSRRSSSSSTSIDGSRNSINNRELFILIRNRSWNEVERRLKRYPQEAMAYETSTGNTALHLACRLDPPSSIIIALKINCRTPNNEGATPLHIAASHRCSKDAFITLLHVCREMQMDVENEQKQQQATDDTKDIESDGYQGACRYEMYGDDDDDVYMNGNHIDTKERTKGNRQRQPASNNITTSMSSSCSATADLSRMGRAPIHYACMSFRGLDTDVFQVLLDATISDGNLWMEEPSSFSSRHGINYYDDDNNACNNMMEDYQINEDDEELYNDLSLNEDEAEDTEEDNDNKNQIIDGDTAKKEFTFIEHDYEQRDDVSIDNTLSGLSDRVDGGMKQQQQRRRILVNVMGLKDGTGQTPLALLFRRYRERVRCVINTLDRLHREHANDPNKMAIAAAVTVHSDLGQLWEKARFIVARLTAQRIANNDDNIDVSNMDIIGDDVVITNNKASDFGFIPSHYNSGPYDGFHSPGEAAVAHEAALWSTEQQALYRMIHNANTVKNTSTDDDTNEIDRNLEETVTLQSDAAIGSLTSNDTASEKCQPGHEQQNERKFRIVHASVGLTGYGCPPELIRLAISIYPHQVSEMDENGNLPLHIASTAASHLAPTMAVNGTMPGGMHHQSTTSLSGGGGGGGGDDHSSVMSDTAMSFFSSATVSQTTNPFDKVIKMLLQQYPHAARIPHGKNGQLPLVMAVECGRRTWEDGLRTLLHAYPPALHNKKLILEPMCYPQILALVANNGPCCTSSSSSPRMLIGGLDRLPIFELPYQQSSSTSYFGGPRSISSFGNAPLHNIVSKSTRKQQQRRQEAYARTTLFDLLRTKPEWITRGLE